MVACRSCGTESTEGFRFCPACGAPFEAGDAGADSPTTAATPREERRLATILFADLAGFTARSETLDPEDVRAFLVPYYEVVRSEIARHGGTVERYLGDGVMAVFGAPAAHEDDPDRAVRAALGIVERLPALRLDLHVRIGINTGLILFAAAGDGREDAITGDAANTASRLQGLAPVDSVVVGESTYRSTMHAFDYRELPPATVKGKVAPVRAYEVMASHARLGVDPSRTHEGPYVGRQAELATLTGAFDACVASRHVRLVTVIGEPGIGKSRIVAELRAQAQRRTTRLGWRQGRCLPYGDGVTFWALGEIVKAEAGILESDPPHVATVKLDAVLPSGDAQAWMKQRLLPLLGIESSSTADREELFTAWQRFLVRRAADRPTVLVFEDVHWADDAMIAFLEHLAANAIDVPLLVIATARPEFVEGHPDLGAGLSNVSSVQLAPLTAAETADLISGLLAVTAVPRDLQGPIVDRAGGNPLYAVEFIHLLQDRDLLVVDRAGWRLRPDAAIPVPASVEALIAARLDALPPATQSMLSDAAVIGKVFWDSALVQMGERDIGDVTATLRDLSDRGLVQQAGRSSIEGGTEFGFAHVLTRDVAYERLTRSARSTRHVAAAVWIETHAGARVEDVADVLAHHYAAAIELAEASGQTSGMDDLRGAARRSLTLAGERALGLDATAALGHLDRALKLAPVGDPGRPDALARFGQAALQAGRFDEAADALTEAIASFREQGHLGPAARSMGTLSVVLSRTGDPRWIDLPGEAVALLDPLPPGPDLVSALTESARAETIRGRPEAGAALADRALGVADQLGLDRTARALGFRGRARVDQGDVRGIDDIRGAIALALRAGQGHDAAGLHLNLGVALWLFEGMGGSVEVLRSGIAFAQTRGLVDAVNVLEVTLLDALIDAGEHDEARPLAAAIEARLESDGDEIGSISILALQVGLQALRGEDAALAEMLDRLEPASRRTERPDQIVTGLGSAAVGRARLGQVDRAAALLGEVAASLDALGHEVSALMDLVRVAVTLGDLEFAERLSSFRTPITPYSSHMHAAAEAALAEARGDRPAAVPAYAAAATVLESFGLIAETAFARLGQGRCLVALGRPAEAAAPLREARSIFGRLSAAPALAEIDALLA